MDRARGLLTSITLAAVLVGLSTTAAAQALATVIAHARAEAKKWQPDAQLFQIELTGFGFATEIRDVAKYNKLLLRVCA